MAIGPCFVSIQFDMSFRNSKSIVLNPFQEVLLEVLQDFCEHTWNQIFSSEGKSGCYFTCFSTFNHLKSKVQNDLILDVVDFFLIATKYFERIALRQGN